MEAEILRTFDALFEALLRDHDPAAATALFVDEPDIAMWGSLADEQAIGREAVAADHREIASWGEALDFEWSVRNVRVDGDTAWVNAAGTMTISGEGGVVRRAAAYRLTAVLVRRGGEWLWHTFNGSEPNG